MSPAPKRKRARRAEDDGLVGHKRKKSRTETDDDGLDLDAGVNTVFAGMDSQLLADQLAQKTARFGSDLSKIELADLHISRRAVPCQSLRVERALARIADEDMADLLRPTSRVHQRCRVVGGDSDDGEAAQVPRESC